MGNQVMGICRIHDVEQPQRVCVKTESIMWGLATTGLHLNIFGRMASLLNYAYDSMSSNVRRGLIKVLATGPVPQHVAFVMDGNRRYARQRNMAIKEGHRNGFSALQQVRFMNCFVCVSFFKPVSSYRYWKYCCGWG